MNITAKFGLFQYTFKSTPEFLRSVMLVALAVMGQVVRTTDPAQFTNWHTYLYGVIVGVGHAVLMLVLGKKDA